MGHRKLAFGTYMMVQFGTTNTMKSRRILEIELKASNNSGGYNFMNIFTGKLMHRQNWI